MLSFLGYNFFKDVNCIDPMISTVSNVTKTVIQNGIYDHVNITADVSSPYSSTIPTSWGYLTILNAAFSGNLSAGNVDFIVSQTTAVKIKRRLKNTFDWLTIKEIPIHSVTDLQFVINDFTAKYDPIYEYAFVPVTNNTEGNYVTAEIQSQFKGVFIIDSTGAYRFYEDVEFGTREQQNRIGVHEPFGRQYPVYTSNGIINYETGALAGTIIDDAFEDTRRINRVDTNTKIKNLVLFLNNKKPKIIKDWNGNIKLVMITGNPNISPVSSIGGAIAKVGFNWSELGNAESQKDLYNAGFVDVGE